VSELVVVPTALRRARVERRLCDAAGGTLLGPRVVTLAALAPGLLAAAGEGRTVLGPLSEGLMALAAARGSGLVPGDRPGGGIGRAARRLLAELRTGEVSPDDLRDAAGAAPFRTAERLRAAADALERYVALLEESGALDAAGALRAAATAAERGAVSEETRDLRLLVLEGLLPGGRAALDLGMALASRARRVVARVPFLPEEAALSLPAEGWLRRIEALHELSARHDLRVEFPVTGAVRATRTLGLPATSDESQVDAAARLAADLLDGGMDPAELAVVAPPRILELLPDAFARLAVPVAAPVSRSLATLPVVRDLRGAIAAAGGAGREDLLDLLGSPWLAPGEPVPELRAILDRAGVLDGRGDPEERLRARADGLARAGKGGRERVRMLRAARALQGLRSALGPLRAAATPSGWTTRLRALVDRAGIRRRAALGEGVLARRDLGALARFEEVLDELQAALVVAGRGAERIAPDAWAGLLDLALERADLPAGRGPPSGAVEAWPLEEAPGLDARVVIVLGADRGSWPGAPRIDPLLGNAGREALCAHLGRRAVPTAFHDRSDAEFRGLSALVAAGEVLAVGWTAGSDEEGPAPLAARFLDAAAAPRLLLAADPPLGGSRGIDEALRAAARLAGEGGAGAAAEALAASPELAGRALSAAERGRLERERRDAWIRGEATPAAGAIPEGLGAWREAEPAQWSATELETFASCPYRYLLRTAGVGEPGTGDLDMEPRDEGALVHAVLEELVRGAAARGAWPPRDVAAAGEEAREVAMRVFARFESEGRVGDPATWAARRDVVLRRIERFVVAESTEDPGLRPALLEFVFGGTGDRPPIAIPAPGGDVLVQGRIDRVDEDAGRLLVIDYKNSRSAERARERLSPEALGTTSFQAPLYLLAAARELPGRSLLSAAFALLGSGERVGPWTVDADDPFLALDPERRAAVRAAGGRTLADGVVDAVARIRAGRLPVAPVECTGCPYGAVCRFPRGGEA